VESNLWQTH